MATRLRDDTRALILKSVMQATTYSAQRAAIEAKLQAAAKDYIISQQPMGWFGLVRGHPAEWFKLQAELSIDHTRNPMNMLPDLDGPYRYSTHSIQLEDPVVVAIMVGKTDSFFPRIKDIAEEAKTLSDWFEDTQGQMRSLLASHSTAEKLIERMPELKAHVTKIVKIQKTSPLVAPSNALAMLTKMGFDQTVKK